MNNSFFDNHEVHENKLLVSFVMKRYETKHIHHSSDAIFQFCKNSGVDISFLNAVFEAFCEEDFFPKEALRKFPKEVIIDYLEKTHHFYLNRLIPEIQQHFQHLILHAGTCVELPLRLMEQFEHYHRELITHIFWEENVLFHQLIENSNSDFSAMSKDHHAHELELDSIVTELNAHLHQFKGILPYAILIEKLKLLQKDIAIHAHIEDEVLFFNS